MRRLFRHVGRAHLALIDVWNASPVYRWTLLVSAMLIIASALLPAWRLLPDIKEQGFIPLHYNIYFGIDRYGPWYGIFLPACLGAAVLILNVAFLTVFLRSERLLALCLTWTTLLCQVILLAAVFFMVLLNV